MNYTREQKQILSKKKAQHTYYEKNKVLKKILAVEWTMNNYDKHLLNVKNYYLKHNERLSKKNIMCVCNTLISKKCEYMHKRTKKHMKFINNQI
jgi:hypothetical protein